MKKHFSILSICLVTLSCGKSNLNKEIIPQYQEEQLRSEAEIRDIAMSSISVFSDSAETKCSGKRISSVIPYSIATKSDLSSPVFYIVNFDEDEGFVIVGARHDSPEVIVYSDKGNYDGTNSAIAAFNIYIDEIGSQLKTMSTGCVAVAIAQIMSVYSFPASISLGYSSASVSTQALDWDEMKLASHYTTVHTNTCTACIQLAALLREIGNRVHMSYAAGGSGASSALYARSTLASFGYESSAYQDYSLTSIMNSLNADHPVYIRAGNSDGGGHAWVVDGSKYTCKETTTYLVSNTSRTEVAREYVQNWYLHFNYGWGGSSDGYYIARTRKYGSGSIIVGGSYDYYPVSMFTGVRGFNLNVKIIPDIRPS